MNERYRTLFSLISQTMENTAEKAMEQNKEKGDTEAYETSKEMRDNYATLSNNIARDDYILTKNDFANLYIASLVVVKSIEGRIEKEQASVLAYSNDLMPKLKAAMDNPKNAENIFTVEEK